MDKIVKIFENPKFGTVRTITENGKTLFCGSDVAKALGYKKPQNAISAHCKGALKRGTPTRGGEQEMLFIPEGDIYRLAARSELPGAEEFESWIFDEVLPAIHRTGGYIPVTEEMSDMEILSRAVLIAQNTIERKDEIIAQQKAKIEADAPAVEFANNVRESSGTISVGAFSKITFDRFGLGRNKMHAWLRENKFLTKEGVPAQRYMNAGWFQVYESFYNGQFNATTRITGKGQVKLYEKLALAFPECA